MITNTQTKRKEKCFVYAFRKEVRKITPALHLQTPKVVFLNIEKKKCLSKSKKNSVWHIRNQLHRNTFLYPLLLPSQIQTWVNSRRVYSGWGILLIYIYTIYKMGRGFHINGRVINNLFLWIFWVEEKKIYGKDDKPKKLNHVSFHYLQIIYIIVLSCFFFSGKSGTHFFSS